MMRHLRQASFLAPCGHARRGTILILVLVIALGLVTMTIYFADSMVLEYRGADNEVAGLAAGQAGAGACRYLVSMLKKQEEKGRMPRIEDYRAEAEPLGEDAQYWLVARDHDADQPSGQMVFGLVDEASKININSASQTILEGLPRMNTDVAAAIVYWRTLASDATTSDGTQSDPYTQLSPAYKAKKDKFESPDELRLVMGMTWELLYGEDANRNGILDSNENDGDETPPADNRDGKLDPGLLEYVTVWSREPNTRKDGTKRINIRGTNSEGELRQLLGTALGNQRGNEIMNAIGPRLRDMRSVLEFFQVSSELSKMTEDEFAKVEDALTDRSGDFITGRINVNTASELVLDCLPGLVGTTHAAELIAARRGENGRQPEKHRLGGQCFGQEHCQASRPISHHAELPVLRRRGLAGPPGPGDAARLVYPRYRQ